MSDQGEPSPETHLPSDERVRELACFYEIADLLKDSHADPRRVFKLVVQVIPLAWQHSETCTARIRLEHLTFQSAGFREVPPTHSAAIFVEGEQVGTVEVCCEQHDPQTCGETLAPEKCRFLNTIAKRLGSFLSLQQLLRLSALGSVLDREVWASDNHDSTDETGGDAPLDTENGGLCMTCVHSATCAYRRRRNHPVMSCEEFDDGAERPKEISANKELPDPDTKAQADEATPKTPEYTGLCATCDNRETCTFPKPEGGIWHCEEFA